MATGSYLTPNYSRSQTNEQKKRILDQPTFHIALARQLIDGDSSRKRNGRPASFLAKKCVVPDHVRYLVGEIICQRGFPTMDDLRKGQDKRSRYMCAECDVPLCIATYFSSFNGK
ncbi:hypothetical protein TNCV_2354291 [Trichonephila clavipes]|nr:hypothetical protein TNCV_2354291 [Trichonephila clavipes]